MTAFRNTDPDLPEKPSGYFVLMPFQGQTRLIDFAVIKKIVWDAKYLILAGALAGALIAAIHAFFIAVPIYRSQATVAIQLGEANAGSSLSSAMGGLATLSGLGLGPQNSVRSEFIAVLHSRKIIATLIQTKNLLPLLFSEDYDAQAKRWRQPESPPSLQDGVDLFRGRVYQVSEDRQTSLVTIQVDWKDRSLAQQWVLDIINLTNQQLRATALNETRQNLDYLTRQSQQVQVESLRQSITRLMESNLNRAMLANSQQDYAIKIIDPPTVPDPNKRVSPNRKAEIVAGLVLGALLILVFQLWRFRKSILR